MKPGAPKKPIAARQKREQRTQAAPISREMQSKTRGTKHGAWSMELEACNKKHFVYHYHKCILLGPLVIRNNQG
jgi:hypothetical protein